MRVLLAFDGSAGAAEAVSLAQAIAWPADSRLRIVSVVEPGAWVPPLPRVPMTTAPVLEPELVAYLEGEQAEIVKRLPLVSRTEAAILRGRPGSTIIDDARDFAADLVMVGSRGHGPIASLVLGSVSAEVVDHAPCPVLVARRGTVKRVVIATDDSPSARAAEDLVAGWPIFDGLPIDVISVADAVRPWTSGIAPMFQRQARDAYAHELNAAIETAERVASNAAGRLRQGGRDADATVGRGDPAAEIVDFAENSQADLIVLGSRGRSALAEILLGSVARNVLAGSTASVLVVREAAANDRESGPEHSSAARAGADQVRKG
jgi:nucleotide-binding universal stress UspA family protein